MLSKASETEDRKMEQQDRWYKTLYSGHELAVCEHVCMRDVGAGIWQCGRSFGGLCDLLDDS